MKRCTCGNEATHTAIMCYHDGTPNHHIIGVGYVCAFHMFDKRCNRPQYALVGVHTQEQARTFYSQFSDSVDIDYVMELTLCK